MLVTIGSLLLGIALILVIIAFNGYFVAQEFAYMSVDRNRLKALAEQGDSKAKRALAVTNRTSFMLSGAQLGITVTGLLVGFIAEPLVGQALAVLVSGGEVPSALSITVGTALALIFSTVVQMIFGELFPKNYTIAAPMKSARALAASTTVYLKLFGWIIRFFDGASEKFLKLFKIKPVEDVDASANPQDLKHIVSRGRETGELDYQTSLLLSRLLDFPDVELKHAMRPHSRVDFLLSASTVAQAKEKMVGAHTRYPVLNESMAPVGTLNLLDVLSYSGADSAPITELTRKPVVLHENMRLPEALQELQEANEKLAVVIDEYGGFVGIVTTEDMAEEVLGEMSDEHDLLHSERILETGTDTWIADGDTPLDELERLLGRALPTGNYETVAGLLMHQAGSLVAVDSEHLIRLQPEVDDILERNENPDDYLLVRVLEVQKNVPARVRLFLVLEHEGQQ